VIPALTAAAESLGMAAALVPLALGGFLTAVLLFLQSLARLFDDQDS